MQGTHSELFQALDESQFLPYFQPLVNLRDGTIRGFEVLARWQHPGRGLVPPNEFLPSLEKEGLMNRFSELLFKQAFAAAGTLPPDVGLSINISPSQLHDPSLPELLNRLADAAEFDLKRLTVEITESGLIDNLQLAGRIATDIKALGSRLSLDDFGTGYSSLLHLQALPFDELKVDMSFVRSMVKSRQSRKIAATVVSLGVSLGLQTVGEGIEEQDQANLLAWQGCNLGQGYLFGRPVPSSQLADTMRRGCCGVNSVTDFSASMTDLSHALDSHPDQRLSQLRALYDSAPVGIAFIDSGLRYLSLNRRLASMNHAYRTVASRTQGF